MYHEIIKEHITEDAEGNITTDTTRTVKSYKKNEEPDYIKLYTRMWLEFNNVPEKWRPLFLSLICRMSYASLTDNEGGQIVYTVGPNRDAIINECGWKTKGTLYRGLQALCECNAIRQITKGVYQINPEYAGRGPWQYNAREAQGGVSNLIAKFNFADKSVDTRIIWASTDKEIIPYNSDEVIVTETTSTPIFTPISSEGITIKEAAARP